MDSAAARIRQAMQAVATLRVQRAKDSQFMLAGLEIKRFQAQRFKATYDDLLTQGRYRRASVFFLEELYGEQDYGQRDQQFARIASTIARLFPQTVVETAALLAEVHALTEKLDDQMAQHWVAGSGDSPPRRYLQCWRAVADRPARRQQLEAVLQLGQALDRLTRLRGLRSLLRMMRAPAAGAGLSSLQTFLESGFDAFADMKGAADFLAIIESRESAWIDALFDADTVACETSLRQLLEGPRGH